MAGKIIFAQTDAAQRLFGEYEYPTAEEREADVAIYADYVHAQKIHPDLMEMAERTLAELRP